MKNIKQLIESGKTAEEIVTEGKEIDSVYKILNSYSMPSGGYPGITLQFDGTEVEILLGRDYPDPLARDIKNIVKKKYKGKFSISADSSRSSGDERKDLNGGANSNSWE